jgi:2-keto-3-deoxy-galactonokinase
VIAMGWIVAEYVLVPAIRFDFANPVAALQNWNQQPLWFLIGLAMVVLALRVASGGWRGILHAAHLA